MPSSHIHRWLLLAFCLLMQALTIGLSTYAFTFFVMPMTQEFDSSRSEIMLAMSGFALITGVLSAVCGTLIDRHSPRLLVCIGALAYAAALFAMAMAPSAGVVILLFALLLPFGAVLAGPIMAQTLTARTFVEHRGMALGICALGTSIGGLLIPLIITNLLKLYSWRIVMGIFGVSGLLLIIPPAVLLLRPQSTPLDQPHNHHFLRLLTNRAVLMLSLAYLAPTSVFLSLLHNLGAYATDLSVNPRQAGVVVSITAVMMAVSKFCVGALTDLLSHATLYFSLLALIVSGMLLLIAGDNAASFAVGVPLAGLSMGMMPLIGAITVRHFGSHSFGGVIGVVIAFTSLAGLAPAIVGYLRDVSGTYTTAFSYSLILLLPGVLGFVALNRIPAEA